MPQSQSKKRKNRQSLGEYVLLLNPDTVVGEHTLRDAVAFMDAHPDAGATGVRMLKSDGGDAMESRRGIPTPLTAFYKMSGLCTRFPRNHRLGKYYMSYLPWDQPERIEIVSGAFCLLRRLTGPSPCSFTTLTVWPIRTSRRVFMFLSPSISKIFALKS